MKKLLAVSILLTLLTAAAFAQLGISVYGDFYPDLMKITAPTGDSVDKKDTPANGTGTFDFLSSSNMTKGDNELRLNLSYKDPKEGKYEGLLQLKGDKAIPRGAVENIPGTSAKDLMGYLVIGDFYLKGTAGPLTGYIGDTSNRGATASFRFANFNNFIDNRKLDNFGVQTTNGYLDVNNLQKSMKQSGASQLSMTYASLTANFAPISVDIAGDLGMVVDPTTVTNSYSQAGGAVRVSGSKLLNDFLNLDVIYKIHGADPDTNSIVKDQPDDQGIYDHSFGLYAGISVMKDLALGVGYSGYVRTHENATNNNKYIYPLFSGIDLRLKFTGVDKLSLIFNNNISFAGTTGDDDDATLIVGLNNLKSGQDIGGKGANGGKELTESSFFMANMLGIFYKVTDDLTGSFQVGNKLTTYNETDGRESTTKKTDSVTDQLWVAAGAEFTLGSNVLLGAALRLDVDSTSKKVTDTAETNGGLLTFGIPLRIKVQF
jgi:hypothetical protein